jgi:hypothetical protein
MDDDEIIRLAMLEDEARREEAIRKEEERLDLLRSEIGNSASAQMRAEEDMRRRIEKENINNKNINENVEEINPNLSNENNFLSNLKMTAELDYFKRNPKWDRRLDGDIKELLKLNIREVQK